jgi:hypothetical protein
MNSSDPIPTVFLSTGTVVSTGFPTDFFKYLSPCNLTLAVYIMIQNSMIIYDYHKDWRRLSSFLFILIAAVDIVSACTEIGRGSIALICLSNESSVMPSTLFTTFITLGALCYVTSTFCGMVLTFVKTINIINPFYRIHGQALRVCLVMVSSFVLIISANDLTIRSKVFQSWGCKGFWDALIHSYLVGEFSLSSLNAAKSWFWFLITIEFFLPCLFVLVCMILQMVYIKRAFSQSADPKQNTANQVNVTIFLISLLYLLSSSLFSFFMMYLYIQIQNDSLIYIPFKRLMLARYTLPLLNAALFPTILILRKPDLRARYRGYISAVLFLPVSLFYRIHRGIRARGYTEI